MKTPAPQEAVFLLAVLLCYISFWYSSLRVFKRPPKTTAAGYALKLLTLGIWYGTFIEGLFFGGFNSPPAVIAGSGLALFALWLFWLAARHIREKEFAYVFSQNSPQLHLITGPYRYVRHPFYTAYLLCYLSSCIAVSSVLVPLLVLTISVVYFFAARNEERNFLNSDLSDSYSKYRRSTGMFFPIFKTR